MKPDVKLSDYDRHICFFSGGKDSLAIYLQLLELGLEPGKIELHHHLVDGAAGEGGNFMEWPITPGYVEAIAREFGSPLSWSWREGGFLREMGRDGTPTAPVHWITADGTRYTAPVVENSPPGTRGCYPQVSADLNVRWCSAKLKIDVASRWIANDPTFKGVRTLVHTGERAQESPNRARYAAFGPHIDDLRNGLRYQRHIDHLRIIHPWKESQVWEIIERWGVVPHPCYRMGWSRCSCRDCIFANDDQVASMRLAAPRAFRIHVAREALSGWTIHRKDSLEARADRGTPYAAITPELIRLANSEHYYDQVRVNPGDWQLPAGAYGKSLGPT